MKTAVYARCATKEQLDDQIEFCKKATTKNDEVTIYADSNFSGTNTNRPGFQNLLLEIEKDNINKVIVRDHSRISRSTIDLLNFHKKLKNKNIKLISVDGTSID